MAEGAPAAPTRLRPRSTAARWSKPSLSSSSRWRSSPVLQQGEERGGGGEGAVHRKVPETHGSQPPAVPLHMAAARPRHRLRTQGLVVGGEGGSAHDAGPERATARRKADGGNAGWTQRASPFQALAPCARQRARARALTQPRPAPYRTCGHACRWLFPVAYTPRLAVECGSGRGGLAGRHRDGDTTKGRIGSVEWAETSVYAHADNPDTCMWGASASPLLRG